MYDKIGKVRLQQRFIVMETGCLFCLGSSNSKFPASLYKLNLASSGTIDTPQRPVCSLPFGRSFFRGHYFSPRSGSFLMFIILVWMILQQTVHTTFSKISITGNWGRYEDLIMQTGNGNHVLPLFVFDEIKFFLQSHFYSPFIPYSY